MQNINAFHRLAIQADDDVAFLQTGAVRGTAAGIAPQPEIRRAHPDLRFLLSGPWPPYSFVTPPEGGERSDISRGLHEAGRHLPPESPDVRTSSTTDWQVMDGEVSI